MRNLPIWPIHAGLIKKLQNLWAVDDDEGDRTQKVKAEANDLTKLTRIIDHQYQNSTAIPPKCFLPRDHGIYIWKTYKEEEVPRKEALGRKEAGLLISG